MRSDQIGPILWLVAFVGSGIGLGQTFELTTAKGGRRADATQQMVVAPAGAYAATRGAVAWRGVRQAHATRQEPADCADLQRAARGRDSPEQPGCCRVVRCVAHCRAGQQAPNEVMSAT